MHAAVASFLMTFVFISIMPSLARGQIPTVHRTDASLIEANPVACPMGLFILRNFLPGKSPPLWIIDTEAYTPSRLPLRFCDTLLGLRIDPVIAADAFRNYSLEYQQLELNAGLSLLTVWYSPIVRLAVRFQGMGMVNAHWPDYFPGLLPLTEAQWLSLIEHPGHWQDMRLNGGCGLHFERAVWIESQQQFEALLGTTVDAPSLVLLDSAVAFRLDSSMALEENGGAFIATKDTAWIGVDSNRLTTEVFRAPAFDAGSGESDNDGLLLPLPDTGSVQPVKISLFNTRKSQYLIICRQASCAFENIHFVSADQNLTETTVLLFEDKALGHAQFFTNGITLELHNRVWKGIDFRKASPGNLFLMNSIFLTQGGVVLSTDHSQNRVRVLHCRFICTSQYCQSAIELAPSVKECPPSTIRNVHFCGFATALAVLTDNNAVHRLRVAIEVSDSSFSGRNSGYGISTTGAVDLTLKNTRFKGLIQAVAMTGSSRITGASSGNTLYTTNHTLPASTPFYLVVVPADHTTNDQCPENGSSFELTVLPSPSSSSISQPGMSSTAQPKHTVVPDEDSELVSGQAALIGFPLIQLLALLTSSCLLIGQ